MRLFMLIVVYLLVLASCDKSDDPPILNTDLSGTWKFVEIYADPGGGGEWRSVKSDKTLRLNGDGTYYCNGDICSTEMEATRITSGTYSATDTNWKFDNCESYLSFAYTFYQEDLTLIIAYPCIEPCLAKYQKIKN